MRAGIFTLARIGPGQLPSLHAFDSAEDGALHKLITD